MYYAHSLEDRPEEYWQLLKDHLLAVQKEAADRGRGLKPLQIFIIRTLKMSLPTWGRGLKLCRLLIGVNRYGSLPTWGRGLKHFQGCEVQRG